MNATIERSVEAGGDFPEAVGLVRGGRVPPSLALALALACGGGDSQSTSPGAPTPASGPVVDRPPVIDTVQIEPSSPMPGDEIVLELEAHDPDGDPLSYEIEWLVNGETRERDRRRFDTSELKAFDTVWVQVRVKSREREAHAQSGRVRIEPLPEQRKITEIRFLPDPPLGSESTTAEVHVDTPDATAQPEIVYEWRVNGRLLSEKGPLLAEGTLRRGQRVQVRAAIREADGALTWFESPEVRVGNSEPEIESRPPLSLPEGEQLYRYQIRASDPDDDRPLRYDLVEGPEGMRVDLYTGLLEWQITEAVQGAQAIEVAVRDGNGGRSSQRYELVVSWEDAPAKRD